VMYKYFGMAIIFISLVYAGQYKTYTYRQRHRQLGEFTALTDHIATRIKLYSLRLDEIYASCPDDGSGFADRLKSGQSFTDALDEVKLYIEADEFEVLREFGTGLGRSGLEEQLRLCEYTSERLKKAYDSCSGELAKKIKLANSLSLLAALMAMILLI